MFFDVQAQYISDDCVAAAHRRVGLSPLSLHAARISMYRQAKKLGGPPEEYGLTAEDVAHLHNPKLRYTSCDVWTAIYPT